jgi:two-component system, NarL family, sensor kinase
MHTQETRIYIAILVAFFVLFVLVGFFVMTAVKYQKKMRSLHGAQIKADMLMLEKERARMASELHDDFGAYVSVVKYKLQSMDITGAENIQYMREAEKLINDMMLKIRHLSYDLMPMLLQSKGLNSSLSEFISMIRQGKKLRVDYTYSIQTVAAEKKIHYFRIVQEIVNNAVKHAQATEIKVLLYETRLAQYIEVKDNGRGFDKRTISKHTRGIGMLNIQARTQLLNGKLFLETAPNTGTQYIIEIPLI